MSRALRLGAVLALGAAAVALYGSEIVRSVTAAAEWTRGLGPLGLAAFAGIYAVATVFAVPGSALTLLAGGAFGFFAGTLSVWVGATVGLAGAFLVARRFARGPVSRWLERKPSFAAVDRAVAAEGMKIVFLTRLTPVFPFTFLNYAYGLTGVSFGAYFVGSAIGILPGSLLYLYIGSLAGEAASGQVETVRLLLYFGGLAAAVAATVLITRSARRALRQAGIEEAGIEDAGIEEAGIEATPPSPTPSSSPPDPDR